MKYLAQLNGTDNGQWFDVYAETERDAALQALRLASARQVLPVDKLLPCTVYVSDGKHTYRHANGAPLVVHRFELVSNKAED